MDEDTGVNKEEVPVVVEHLRSPSISLDYQLQMTVEAKKGARVVVEVQSRGDGKSQGVGLGNGE